MGYYLFYLFFAFIICLAYGSSFYLYLLLELSVKQKKEVPNWFYRIGQSMQDRIHRVKLENRTNYDALKQSRIFLRGMLLLSFFAYLFFHAKSHAISSALLNCGKLCRKRMFHHQLGSASSFRGKHGATTVSHFVSIDLSPKALSIIFTLFGRSIKR